MSVTLAVNIGVFPTPMPFAKVDHWAREMQECGESDDDDDPMDKSFAVLSSSEGEEHKTLWDEPESGLL
jgi:hypothetical protein